MWQLEVTVDI